MTHRHPSIVKSTVTSSVVAIFVVLLGVSALSWATNTFSIWTAEDARRLRVLTSLSELPGEVLLNQHSEERSIGGDEKQFIVLDFIYTRCPTVCNTLGIKFQQLQNEIAELGISDRVEVLSISFDLKHDSPETLRHYLNLHKADGAIWNALVPQTNQILDTLIEHFGVVIIDDEFGGYTHNTAIYVVENDQLKKIFNDNDIESALAYIVGSLSAGGDVQASR